MTIRPFRIAIDSADIADLQRRLRDTRWPTTIPGTGWDLGMDGAFLQSLTNYWLRDFDWRTIETHLNRLPQFTADTAHGRIHFVHLRGVGHDPIPIVLTHGWPSTFAELANLGRLLANPSSHGANEGQSFDVVIPSLPGYIFSSAPASRGSNVFKIADQWSELMAVLGYRKFIAHGGDIGAGVSTCLGLNHSDRVLGVHLNFIPGSYQPYVADATDLSADESEFFARRAAWLDREGGYSHVQATKPDVLGPALNDSPVGLAAWIIDKYRAWSDCGGDVLRRFTYDELLTVVSLYWFTSSMPAAIRLYWEGRQRPLKFAAGQRVQVPVAVAHFPREIPIPPRSYVERGYNVTRWTEFARGGHFAAIEEPQALAADIRAFASSLGANAH
jgi:pimeloyl-ACP methyl ester carboxylesterase